MKLISTKDTFVHKEHIKQIINKISPGQPWQFKKISMPEKTLLKIIENSGTILLNELINFQQLSIEKPGKIAGMLEKRLLIYSLSYHTNSGHHSRKLYSRAKFVKVFKIKRNIKNTEYYLYNLLIKLNDKFNVNMKFPWN